MMQTKEDVDKNVRTMPSRQRPNTVSKKHFPVVMCWEFLQILVNFSANKPLFRDFICESNCAVDDKPQYNCRVVLPFAWSLVSIQHKNHTKCKLIFHTFHVKWIAFIRIVDRIKR